MNFEVKDSDNISDEFSNNKEENEKLSHKATLKGSTIEDAFWNKSYEVAIPTDLLGLFALGMHVLNDEDEYRATIFEDDLIVLNKEDVDTEL